MITVRLAETAAEIATCLRLRWTVFVEEQGVRPSDEIDAYDGSLRSDAVHVLALLNGIPAGAARMILIEQDGEPGVAKLQRMAVVAEARQRGLGRALLTFLEGEARRRGARALTLGAQTHARGFYEKQGYQAHGGEFDDAGIPHLRMDKLA